MFTGIIQALGKIERSEPSDGDIRLTIACGDLDMTQVQVGDSIAVNGACLTAVELPGQSFVADVSVETMEKTSLGQLAVGSPVNLETALTLRVLEKLSDHSGRPFSTVRAYSSPDEYAATTTSPLLFRMLSNTS